MRAGTRRRRTRGSWARAPAASPRRPPAPSAATRMDSASARKSKPGTKAQSGEAGRTTPGLVLAGVIARQIWIAIQGERHDQTTREISVALRAAGGHGARASGGGRGPQAARGQGGDPLLSPRRQLRRLGPPCLGELPEEGGG